MIHMFKGLLHRGSNVKNVFQHQKLFYLPRCLDSNVKYLCGSKWLLHPDDRGNPFPKTDRQMPTLVYFQNPITWLINKIDFKMLKTAWDPDFDENEFKRGSIQAVSVICTLISKNLWDSLRGLLTSQALARLQRDVELNWSNDQRNNIFMSPSDIKMALPRKIHFLKIGEKKFVDVDMMFVAMKFRDLGPSFKNDILLIELIARFHRNYTTGEIPNWTVTLFKVTRFNGAAPNK